MTRYALIESGVVATVTNQDEPPQVEGIWVACGDAGPGWLFDGTDFAPPTLDLGTRMTHLAFKNRIPNAKWRAARASARAGNADLLDFFEDFDMARYIDVSDEKLIYAMNAMSTDAFTVDIRLTAPEVAVALAHVTDPDDLPGDLS